MKKLLVEGTLGTGKAKEAIVPWAIFLENAPSRDLAKHNEDTVLQIRAVC